MTETVGSVGGGARLRRRDWRGRTSGRRRGRQTARTEADGGDARGHGSRSLTACSTRRSGRRRRPVADFVQTEPVEGQPATERTEVRILYDDKAIYVGVICFDSEPSRIVTTDSRRDSGLSDMDSFQMILDTYHDQQNGFIFGTNAVGTQYDAQVRNEGETGGGGGAPTARPDLRRVRRRRQRELGRRLGREGARHRDGVDRGVRDSASHAALRSAAAGLGAQLPAQHRAEARDGLLVARVAHLQPHAPVVCRRAARTERGHAAQPEAHALRARLGEPELLCRPPTPTTGTTSASTPRSA